MTGTPADLVLDGNAAAGLLQEIFVGEVTLARVRCGACGAVEPVGALRLYGAPMGVVLRCCHCEALVLRAVETPYGRWLEMPGARHVRFRPDASDGEGLATTTPRGARPRVP